MASNLPIINRPQTISTGLPLAGRSLNSGFKLQLSLSNQTDSQDAEAKLDLSRGARVRAGRVQDLEAAKNDPSRRSPLLNALDALGAVADRIAALQKRGSDSVQGSGESSAIALELTALADEYSRIVGSEAFRQFQQAVHGAISGSAFDTGAYNDPTLNYALSTRDPSKLGLLQSGFEGLLSLSLTDVLTDRSLPAQIKDYLKKIRDGLKPDDTALKSNSAVEEQNSLVAVPLPQLKQINIVGADGLTLSLQTFSTKDLIRAAAAHIDLDPINVLTLTITREEDLDKDRIAPKEAPQFLASYEEPDPVY